MRTGKHMGLWDHSSRESGKPDEMSLENSFSKSALPRKWQTEHEDDGTSHNTSHTLKTCTFRYELSLIPICYLYKIPCKIQPYVSWPIFHRLKKSFCSIARKWSCTYFTSTWVTVLRNSVRRTQRTWRTFPVRFSGCHLRTQHPLAITLKMPGSDSERSDGEHKEGWTGVLISSQRYLTESEILARADLRAFEVKSSELVLEWADTQDLELQHSVKTSVLVTCLD